MFTSTNADKHKANCAKCHNHNNDYIQVSSYSNAPNAFPSNKSRKQITNPENKSQASLQSLLDQRGVDGAGEKRDSGGHIQEPGKGEWFG